MITAKIYKNGELVEELIVPSPVTEKENVSEDEPKRKSRKASAKTKEAEQPES